MATTYKIGEAAALLNLKTYVLRFWETEFPHIVPLRTDKGQRLYTEDNLALLERIRFLLHERGLTIEGARKVLNEDKEKGVTYAFTAAVNALPVAADETEPESNPEPEGEAELESEAEPDTDPAGPEEENPGAEFDSDNALSAAGKAVKKFLSQYNLPGISKTYPIHEKPLSERLDSLRKNEQPALRRHDHPANAPGAAVADDAGDAVFSGDNLSALSPIPQGAPRALLRDLATELESIAGLLRGGRS